MNTMTCGFIGLGLIGGSIAKAIKSYDSTVKIIAYDINKASLRQAVSDQIVDWSAEAIDESFQACDIIFLCAPVQKNDENLAAVKRVISPDCILTDVGSVKSTIHEAIKEAGLEQSFIGGHPMAGSERTGYINSRAVLLENAYYILTPTEATNPNKLAFYHDLVLHMNAIPLVLDYRRHDYITAAISHLPHVIAASLVNLVRESDDEEGIMKMVAAGGFKDITRIASSSAAMWQQICLTNGSNISLLLQKYIASLQTIFNQLQAEDGSRLYDLFDSARIYRDSFISASSGPIKRSFSFNVDIADKTGAIAEIATILASRNISIKNIGIVHNREAEDGVMGIEVYTEADMNSAALLLQEAGYCIHIRA